MRIFDLSIQNFRGIKELRNLRVGEVNSFVGKNDAGKSAILRALDAFFNNKFGPNDVHKGILDDEVVEIQIRFEPNQPINSLALDIDLKISLKKQFSFTPTGRVKTEVFYTCNDVADENYQNCWNKKEQDLNTCLNDLGLDHSRSGRGVTNLSKIEQITEAIQGFDREEKTYPVKDLLQNLENQYGFFEMPEFSLFDAEQDLNVASTDFQKQFKPIANQALENNSALTTQIEDNVQTELETEFSTIAQLMKKNVPDLERIIPSVNCNWKNLVKFDLSLKFRADTFEIPISNKGTGFKRLLMVAYFEYLAQKQTKQYQIFGIEEPETYLHPELQHDLLESIIDLSDESQFFLTTHSPIFAGATKTSNIIVVKKENELSEYFNYANEDDILNVVIQELGIRPNYNLLNDDYRKAIFVEGKGDVLFWQKALDKLTSVPANDLLFIPCGGDQVEFFVNAELCRKINRHFIFIVDSDKGAVDYASKLANKQNLKQRVESLGGIFKVLHKREIENYYHPDAIQRILEDRYTLPDDFTIGDYVDVKELLKTEILNNCSVNLKTKNNFEIFDEMTPEEWREAGTDIEDSTDIELILECLLS